MGETEEEDYSEDALEAGEVDSVEGGECSTSGSGCCWGCWGCWDGQCVGGTSRHGAAQAAMVHAS